MKHFVSYPELRELAAIAARKINAIAESTPSPHLTVAAYPVPRGGVPAALAIQAAGGRIRLVDNPDDAEVIIDDIYDSGATYERFAAYDLPFVVLIDKRQYNVTWVVFPWENRTDDDESITDNVVRMLQYIGEDPTRGGLLETPKRVVKALAEMCSGYGKDPKAALKVFEDGAESCDQIVIVKDIPIYSMCEHHMLPFFGIAHVGYIPNGKVVGLSKIPEVVDIFARRLQVQERLTNQVADALYEHLNPKGVGVVINARHMCMEARGKRKSGSSTTTSALRGALVEEQSCRAEFFSLIKL